MILYVWCERGRKGKRNPEGHTLKFDLAKYSSLEIQRILSHFDTFKILSYKHC